MYVKINALSPEFLILIETRLIKYRLVLMSWTEKFMYIYTNFNRYPN